MFAREAGLLASLRHANMPGVFDHFIEDGALFGDALGGRNPAGAWPSRPRARRSRMCCVAGQLCDILPISTRKPADNLPDSGRRTS
jgi:hypothetical protein